MLGFDGEFGYQGPEGREFSLARLGDAFAYQFGSHEPVTVPHMEFATIESALTTQLASETVVASLPELPQIRAPRAASVQRATLLTAPNAGESTFEDNMDRLQRRLAELDALQGGLPTPEQSAELRRMESYSGMHTHTDLNPTGGQRFVGGFLDGFTVTLGSIIDPSLPDWLEYVSPPTSPEAAQGRMDGSLVGQILTLGFGGRAVSAPATVARRGALTAPPPEPLVAPGSLGSTRVWSMSARLKAVRLPTSGRIRFVPPRNYHPSRPLPRGPNNGFVDRFGNEWVHGPPRTRGEPFEWDVQLSRTGREQLGWLSRDPNQAHINVSLRGRVSH